MMSVPIPPRLAKLERDRRGYPIPVGVLRDETGRPHFTINDEAKRQHHMRDGICPLCGDKLFRGRWFVGGPRAAFHELGAFIDPPMHAECARYALRVCPFLAAPRYGRRLDDKTLPAHDGTLLLMEEECRDERPALFVAVMATGQSAIHFDNTVAAGGMLGAIRFLQPKRPFSHVEFWRHGEHLSYPDALAAMTDDADLEAFGYYVAKHGPVNKNG